MTSMFSSCWRRFDTIVTTLLTAYTGNHATAIDIDAWGATTLTVLTVHVCPSVSTWLSSATVISCLPVKITQVQRPQRP